MSSYRQFQQTMALKWPGEGIILPEEPLFLVQKGWKAKYSGETSLVTRAELYRPARAIRRLGERSRQFRRRVGENSSNSRGYKFVNSATQEIEPTSGHTSWTGEEKPRDGRPTKDTQKPMPATFKSARAIMASLSPVGHNSLYVNYYFHQISAVMYPLSSFLAFNPVKRDWLPTAMADEVWFPVILYVSAITLASQTGYDTTLRDAPELLNMALQNLNHRLAANMTPSDETMGAVACLAMLDNSAGNVESALLHTRGLIEMVQLKGGMLRIKETMRTKVYRGILDVAVDSDTRPLLHYECHSVQMPSPVVVSRIQWPPNLEEEMVRIAQELSYLNDFIEQASHGARLDPKSFDNQVFGVQQRLLHQSQEGSHENEAVRIALLLYVKSLTRPLAQLTVTSSRLTSKLRNLIDRRFETTSSLMLWLLFMWGLCAVKSRADEAWIRNKILAEGCGGMEKSSSWGVVRRELKRVLWVGSVHDAVGSTLWARICNSE
ncbi:hypothetical protein GQ53DRAFT_738107 [Thozetella sp. PMI_491]|nr:hypothetical protein GQ53DRAFT_738107 [Thozetella sp. PMI_491]